MGVAFVFYYLFVFYLFIIYLDSYSILPKPFIHQCFTSNLRHHLYCMLVSHMFLCLHVLSMVLCCVCLFMRPAAGF